MKGRLIPIPSRNRDAPIREPRDNEYPCAVCGNRIPKWTHSVLLGNGGASLLTPEEAKAARNDPGFMASYPIGPECRKRIPKEYVVKV